MNYIIVMTTVIHNIMMQYSTVDHWTVQIKRSVLTWYIGFIWKMSAEHDMGYDVLDG